MRTPAGRECKHYYEDFHRGREVQECRLAQGSPGNLRWRPDDCARCPVPDILNANASPDLELTWRVDQKLLGLVRRVTVTAHCLRHDIPIENPYTGCPRCASARDGLDVFRRALEDDRD
jgi:hypothetical protein